MTRPPNILVIEDDPLYRTLYTASIARICPQARIEQACDGEQARARVATCDFDVVVMDLHMPVLDGAAWLAEVKADPRHADLAVLVISAFDALAVRVHRASYPQVFTFAKPLRADEFERSFRHALSLGRGARTRPPAPLAGEALVDRGHIALYVNDDPAVQREVGEQFVLLVPHLVEQLARSVAADDLQATLDACLDAQAAAAVIGAHRAARLAHRLLIAARARDRALAAGLLELLSAALHEYAAALGAA
ncbi:MAG: response regulator [Thauera sp.]|nr:response regulator [Thauera sp.]